MAKKGKNPKPLAAGPRPVVSRAAPARLTDVAVSGPAALRPLVVDANVLGAVLGLCGAVFAVWLVRGVLLTLLFVAVLSFAAAPTVRSLEARGVPRSAAAMLVLVAVALALAGLVGLVVPPLFDDVAKLAEELPQAVRAAADWLKDRFGITVPMQLSDFSVEAAEDLARQVMPFAKASGASSMGSAVGNAVGSGALGVMRGAFGAFGVILQAALVPVLAFFVLAELPGLARTLAVLIPRPWRSTTTHYLPLIDEVLTGLFRRQLVVALILVAVYVVGLSIAGVPLALAIGLLSGAAYLVPFASAAVCLLLSALFALLELRGDAGPALVGALITSVAVQLLEGYVLTPRIVGERAGLSPLAALLAVLLGGSAAGFLGVLFALPVGAVCALVLREESRRRGGVYESEGERP